MKHTGYFIGVGLLLAVLTSPAVAAPVAAAPVVVGDIHLKRNAKVAGSESFAPAVFPHWVHRVNFKCYVCHNKTVGFPMKGGSTAITMEMIDEGKYCGVCHKGKPAFGVSFETCTRCHRK